MIKKGVLMEGYKLRTPEWSAFDGNYEKHFCDIKTKDGEEYGPCYPNAGKFNILGSEKPSPYEIDADNVSHVRYYE